MKEVKSPKKPLIYYYSIILLIVLLFNLIVSPLLMENQVTEVDYGTFMHMIEEKNIGEVEVEDDEILFTDKDKQQVYTTGAMDDPTLTQRLYDSGATFTKEIQKTMSPVLSFVLTAVLLLFNRPLLLAFGASENTIEYAVSYMNIYAIGTIFVQLTLGMNAFITAQGFAKTGMLTVLIGAVCNIVLDPLFIFAFHMGVRGAALATILSQGVSCVWVCAFLRGKKTLLRLRNENIRLRPKFFLPCIALGAASFIMQASESVISVCFNTSLLKYGGDIAVGAMTILTSVMQFAMLPLQGLAQGAQPVLSYNYGAKSAGRVRKAFQLLLISSLVYSTILWGAIQIFPSVFASIFTPNEELIVFAAKALRIYCGVLVLFGIQIACQMTFVSLGNAPCSIIVAVVRKFVLLIPLIYIMPQLVSDQAMGVYMAEPVADVIAVTFTAILFSHQFRKSMTALELEAKNSDA